MRTHHTAAALTAAALLALTGCSSDTTGPAPKPAPPSSAPPAAAPASPATDPAAGTGIPPEPSPEKRAAYIKTLTAIDPEVVNGKEDKAVSRGRDQCAAMKGEKEPTKRVAQVEKRFIGPNHPNGFGPVKSTAILAAVQANICPSY